MATSPDCRTRHLAIVAGTCPRCHRVVNDGHVVWHIPPKNIVPAPQPPPYAAMLPISLMVDGGGFHHQFRDTLGDANRALEAVNTHEVLRRGAKLEPWEAERLERILDEFDGAARLRGHLVGYYLLR